MMVETEEEEIQRLVKEGIAKAKQNEEWENKKHKALDSLSVVKQIPYAIFLAIFMGYTGIYSFKLSIEFGIIISIIGFVLMLVFMSSVKKLL